jgi:hypothetical protein
MISESLKSQLRPIGQLFAIQWFAMVAAIFIYGGVLYFFYTTSWQHSAPSPPRTTPLHSFLPPLAVIAGLGSLTYFRRIASDDRLRHALKTNTSADELDKASSQLAGFGSRPASADTLTPFERRQLNVAHALRIPLTICWALNEAVAIVGLVLAFLAQDAPMFIPYAAGSLVLQVLAFPRLEATIVRTSAWQFEFQT